MLEEARLRCEKARSEAKTGAQQDTLHRLHRELGMAGLAASSHIPSRVRLALLAEAHERCNRSSSESTDGLEELVSIIPRSEQYIARGPSRVGRADHLHLAHVHLLRGQELLDDLLAGISLPTDATHSRP